jgi:zona occludens toxin (predicted ATPase)
MRQTIINILAVAAALAIIALSIDETDRRTCHNKWTLSGVTYRYTFWHGCEVQLTNGRWISTAALP